MIKKGDWVQVWGRVTEVDPHPENYTILFESHNEDYPGLVRRDRVTKPDVLPGFVTACTALYEVEMRLEEGVIVHPGLDLDDGGYVLIRCGKHEGHSGKHKHRGLKWTDHLTHGYIEEAT